MLPQMFPGLASRFKMISVNTLTGFIILGIICCFPLSSLAQDDKIPESEVAEQDSVEERKLSLDGYPFAYYTPETQLAFGAGGIMIFYTGKEKELLPSKVTFSGYYTSNKQYKISLNPALYFNKNKIYFEFPIHFGHYVDKFWGIGNQTIETGNEQYTLDEISISLDLQVPPLWAAADRSGIIFEYNKTEIDDKQTNPFLLQDSVLGSNGGEIYGFGGDLVWDTRDHIFFPNKGSYQYFKIMLYPRIDDFVFYTVELDLRHYNAITPDHVIAGNIYFNFARGEIPFYKLPALGGQNRMRGYFEGRYRDLTYGMMQLEYRQYFWWRLGFIVFGGIGDVAEDLLQVKFEDLKYSYGLGLRYLFNKKEKVNLRLDLGFGQDGNSGIYFGIEEAF